MMRDEDKNEEVGSSITIYNKLKFINLYEQNGRPFTSILQRFREDCKRFKYFVTENIKFIDSFRELNIEFIRAMNAEIAFFL